MSKLIDALKLKYKTPQEALLALGLDASILEVDVIAEDSKEKLNMSKVVMTRKAALLQGALIPFLKPKLAKDAKIDLTPILLPITTKNYKDKKKDIVKGIQDQTKGKLAKDANIEGLVELIDALEGESPMETGDAPMEVDPNSGVPTPLEKHEAVQEKEAGVDQGGHEELKSFLAGKGMAPEDIAKACQLAGGAGTGLDEAEEETAEDEEGQASGLGGEKDSEKMAGAKDTPPDFKGMPKVGGEPMTTKKAMDEAIKKTADEMKVANDKAIKDAVEAERKNSKEVVAALNEVRPWVGNLAMAHDSAADVYRTTLVSLGEDAAEVKELPVSAMKSILKKIPQPGSRHVATDNVAMDSASISDFEKRNPGAARIGII